MPKLTLTDLAIKRFPAPPRGTVTYWDEHTRGLGLRVSLGGARTFVVLVESGRRQALGRYPTISLSDARVEAKRILAEKTLGRIRPTHTAFDDAKEKFLAECEEQNRARTVSDYRRLLARHYPFGRSSIASVTPRDILRRFSKLADVPSERHHAFVAGRVFFRWCVRQHLIDRNPMEQMEVPATVASRERALSDEERTAVYRTATNGSTAFHRIIALLILTGQRRGEISHLEWDWIDEDASTITLPPRITKNKRVHRFPFGAATIAILKSTARLKDNPYVFPAARDKIKGKPATVFNGWGRPKAAFDEELLQNGCTVDPWRIHDLRRTFSSGMAALGISQIVVEKLLNHVSGGTLSPIAQVYNRHAYMDEMRQAIEAWEVRLSRLLRT